MRAFILFHILAILYTLSLFLQGFFPLKKVSSGFATQRVKVPNPDGGNFSSITVYRRLVLLVIDALRADFVLGPFNYLPKTHKIITDGHGLHFIAKVQPPTVTLPRLKAITTGSTPSFVDVVLNFGSPALEEDNIVTQMKRNGMEIVFFGDNTWISLFPGHFERSDGTTSFFVSDYTEVDQNVSRHLKDELHSPTWNVMILHYLGLDHIGHMAGPSSPLVKPKLKEMDDVIRQIYSAMEQWNEPSLLVVCGDHGMRDQGGHGGASPGEIYVPVVFLSPHINNRESKNVDSISQADLCPTLSVLLGLPIPKNNVGKVITEVLIDCTLPQKLSIIHQNAVQAMQILKNYVHNFEKESSYELFIKAKSDFQAWLLAKNTTPVSEWEDQGQGLLRMYSESMTMLADKVTSVSTQYDVYAMAVSMVLQWMILVSLIFNQLKKKKSTTSVTASTYATQLIIAISTAVLSHITMCTGGFPSDLLCQPTALSIGLQVGGAIVFVFSILIIFTHVSNHISLTEQFKIWWSQTSCVEMFLLAGTVAHTFTLTSSSFLEEEHQTFYFLTTSVHLLLIVEASVSIIESYVDKPHMKSKKRNTYIEHKAHKYKMCEGIHYFQGCSNSSGSNEINARAVQTVDHASDDNSNQCNNGNEFPNPSTVKHTSSSNHILKSDSSNNKKPPTSVQTVSSFRSLTGLKSFLIKHNGDCIIVKDFVHFCSSLVSVLFMLRVLRRWNQTGNKWLDVPDFGDWLVLPENKTFLSLAVVFSMMIIGASQGRPLKRVQSMLINLSLTTSYLYRVAEGSLFFPSKWFLSPRGIIEARASFFFIGLTLIVSLLPRNFFRLDPPPPPQEQLKTAPASRETTAYVGKMNQTQQHSGVSQQSQRQMVGRKLSLDETLKQERLTSSVIQSHETTGSLCVPNIHSLSQKWTLEEESTISRHQRLQGLSAAMLCFMCLVMRPHNAPVVALMSLIEQVMTPLLIKSNIKPTYLLLYCLWMGQTFFFFQGNSNSLSTADLTAGYTGLYEFIPAVTGTLLCLATYSGTIFWIITYLRIVCHKSTEQANSEYRLPVLLTRSSSTLLLSCALPLSVYIAIVSVQRYHLFVWTVFSPKLLYEAANTVVLSAIAFLFLLLPVILN